MIDLGVSTACLYPDVTESAVRQLADIGVQTVEIFYNSPSEYQTSYILELKKILDAYGMTAVSMHPYNSVSEPFMFFTSYERRFHDALEEYKRYFEQMNLLGSAVFVFHGDRYDSSFPVEQYFDRFAALAQIGKNCGILVAQENVERCKSRTPSFIRKMAAYLKDDVHFVLDLKQAIRAQVAITDMISAMGNRIVHLHLNDHDEEHDCLLPGKGGFHFQTFFETMEQLGFDGAALIEVYRHNYGDLTEILDSLKFLNRFLSK